MTKKELLSEIECLKNDIKVLEERDNIGFRRLVKCDEYLKSQGLSNKEINDIMRLEEENF